MTLSAIIYGIIEFLLHQKRIYSIPIRIHINGTRGKSSVTRLIGAGLRAGGLTAITKVTGTFPRLILEDGTETHIHRKSDPNILEQLSIVRFASSRKVKALVMECMALQPQYQWITENQMIHANIGIITNVRMDHVDVMGNTLPEIAETLGKTIPKNEQFFSAENTIQETLKSMADKKNTSAHFIDSGEVSKEEMNGFSYIEHRENVAIALSVCTHLNIDRKTALNGMYKAVPDAGALRRFHVEAFQKHIYFFNAFAANDPDSTWMIWQKIGNEIGFEGSPIILLNTRHDRLDRARQLAEMIGRKLSEEIAFLILIGQSTDLVENILSTFNFQRKKIVNLGYTEPSKVFEKLLALTEKTSTVVAIGNMGGMGAETAAFFEHRNTMIND